jgi:glutamine amidotransferase
MFGFLDSDILAGVQGTCDSEYLFALVRHFLADNEDMAIEEAIAESFSVLDDWLGNSEALLNVIISDGELLYAARHGINHDSPSLYYTTDDDQYADAQLVASERLTKDGIWQPVSEHEILVLSADEPPELLAL